MTNYPQMYRKQLLQYLTLVYVDKGVILHFSKWGFTQATATCWNDSSVSLRHPPLLVLNYYARIRTHETRLFYQSPSRQGACAQYVTTTTVLYMLKKTPVESPYMYCLKNKKHL